VGCVEVLLPVLARTDAYRGGFVTGMSCFVKLTRLARAPGTIVGACSTIDRGRGSARTQPHQRDPGGAATAGRAEDHSRSQPTQLRLACVLPAEMREVG
jgi:hypothetical protein